MEKYFFKKGAHSRTEIHIACFASHKQPARISSQTGILSVGSGLTPEIFFGFTGFDKV
jgi:hypothetical protein